MRVGMGLIKNEHGVWQVRKKVPKRLEAARATVLGNGKPRVSWLKETLRTKDKKHATVTAKPIMMKFDRILADAEALLAERPPRTELSETEIKQLAVRRVKQGTPSTQPIRGDELRGAAAATARTGAQVALRVHVGARGTVHGGRVRPHGRASRRRGQARLQGPSSYAAARLWLRIGEQRARHEGTAGLPRAPQHPA
jgi:hypothetical protein